MTGLQKEEAVMAEAFNAKNWRDLIKPRRMEVDAESLTQTYGKFVAEPLERGFGTTLGNSLRRVLLSSLQGAAITSVKIEGVEHEFTTVPEVTEDVTDIVLNLKEVLLRMHTNEQKTLRIEVAEKSRKMIRIAEALETVDRRGVPQWIELDKKAMKGTVKSVPNREDLTMPIQEQLIVELYSK